MGKYIHSKLNRSSEECLAIPLNLTVNIHISRYLKVIVLSQTTDISTCISWLQKIYFEVPVVYCYKVEI